MNSYGFTPKVKVLFCFPSIQLDFKYENRNDDSPKKTLKKKHIHTKSYLIFAFF